MNRKRTSVIRNLWGSQRRNKGYSGRNSTRKKSRRAGGEKSGIGKTSLIEGNILEYNNFPLWVKHLYPLCMVE